MVSIKIKTINGKKYSYASKSLRLPNGKIITIDIRLPEGKLLNSKEIKDSFMRREKEIFFRAALANFKTDHVYTAGEISKIEAIAVDYRRILRNLTKKQLQDLFDRFTVNFTYESNALEGNSLTLKDVAIIIQENIVPKGKDLREIYETRDSRTVVDLILKKKFKISEKDIISMHSMLVKDMGISTGYKTIPNYIVGRKIETTPPEKVAEEMHKLLEWINSNPERLHPLHLAARAHGKFERIHPFEDGNGRVGRFLINVILARNGYCPLIIRKTQRKSYLNALEDFDAKHYATLDRFMLQRYKETFSKFFEVYVKYL